MNHLRLLALPSLLLALTPGAARACDFDGIPRVRLPGKVHLIATASADTVAAGPGGLRYMVSERRPGVAGEHAIHGQVVDVERIGGMAAGELDPSVERVVLVPWGMAANCAPTLWRGSARWVEPGARWFFTATLRDRAHWASGLPTFDMLWVDMFPYQQPASAGRHDGRADSLTVEDYFVLMELLPTTEQVESSAAEAYAPLFRWAEEKPRLARRHPAAAMLSYARQNVANERRSRRRPRRCGARGAGDPPGRREVALGNAHLPGHLRGALIDR